MKEALSNYGRIIITILVLLSLVGLIFGGVWLHKLGDVADEITPNVTPDTINGRNAPTIYLQDQSAIVGRGLYVKGLISAYDADGENISEYLEITSKEGLYNEETGYFLSEEPGSFVLLVSVSDPKAEEAGTPLKTTKKMTIIVNNALDKFLINIASVPHGTVSVRSQISKAENTIRVFSSPDEGYTLESLKIKYKILKTEEELKADSSTQYIEKEEDVSLETFCFTMPAADVVLIPSWKPIDVIVTYNLNGGTSTEETTKTELFGERYHFPAASKLGYVLSGWFTSKIGGTEITNETVITNPKSHTIYARWEKAVYKINFIAREGETLTGNSFITVTYGSRIGTMPTITKNGYNFSGWVLESDESVKITPSTKYKYSEDINVVADWTPAFVSVHFDANGGTVTQKNKSVKFGQPYGTLPTPERKGYDFAGWYTEKDGGDKVDNSSIVNYASEHTLYARWEIQSYKITFAGTFNVNGTQLNSMEIDGITYGSVLDGIENTITEYLVVDERCEFLGWYTAEIGGTRITDGMTYEYNESIVLYAHYTGIKINVRFIYDKDNPSAPQIVKVFETGTQFGSRLPLGNDYVKEGYSFNGWYIETDNEDGTQDIAVNSLVPLPPKDVDLDKYELKVYAKWGQSSKKIHIVADYNKGLIDSSLKRCTSDDDTSVIALFVRGNKAVDVLAECKIEAKNKLFKNWEIIDEDNEVVEIINDDTVLNYNDDITVRPVWRDDVSIVHFSDKTSRDAVINAYENILEGGTYGIGDSLSYVIYDYSDETLGSINNSYPYNSNNNITEVYPSEKIAYISGTAFEKCVNLKHFGWTENIDTIGYRAFAETNLDSKSLEIPGTLSAMGVGAFANLKAKVGLTFDTTDSLVDVVTLVGNITVKNIVGEDDNDINIDAGSEITIVKKYPDNFALIKTVPQKATGENANQIVAKVDLNSLNCTEKEIDKPVTYKIDCIPNNCFISSVNIESGKGFRLPDRLELIGKHAFQDCEITAATISFGKNLKAIDDEAFNNAIAVNNGRAACVLSFSDSEKLSCIGDSAFKDCALFSILFPDNSNTKIEINERAFYNSCLDGHEDIDTALKITDSVVFVGKYIFNECDKLNAVIIQGEAAHSLNRVESTFNNSPLSYTEIPCYIKTERNFTQTNIETLKLTRGINSDKSDKEYYNYSDVLNDEVIDESTNKYVAGFTASIVGENVWKSTLKEVIIDNGVFCLTDNLFKDCTNLTDLTVPITCNLLNAYYELKRTTSGSTKRYQEIITAREREGEKYISKAFSDTFSGCSGIKNVTITEKWVDENGTEKANIDIQDIYNRPEYLYKFYADPSAVTSMDNLFNGKTQNIFNRVSTSSSTVSTSSSTMADNNKKIFAWNNVKTNYEGVTSDGFSDGLDFCEGLNSSGNPTSNIKYSTSYKEILSGSFLSYPWYISSANNDENFQSLTIEDGVIYLYKAMFFNCSSLKEISVPGSLIVDPGIVIRGKHGSIANYEQWIDFDSFGNCINIEKVAITKGINYGLCYNYGNTTQKMAGRVYVEMGSNDWAKNYIDNKSINAWIDAAFSRLGTNNTPWYDSNNALDVIFGNGVVSIGNNFFGNSVELPETARNNHTVQITGIKTLKTRTAFDYKRVVIKNIIIPDSVSSIKNNAFANVEWRTENESIGANITIPIDIYWDNSQFSSTFSVSHRTSEIYFGSNMGTNNKHDTVKYVSSVASHFNNIVFTKGHSGISLDYNEDTYKNLPWAIAASNVLPVYKLEEDGTLSIKNPDTNIDIRISSVALGDGVERLGNYLFYTNIFKKNSEQEDFIFAYDSFLSVGNKTFYPYKGYPLNTVYNQVYKSFINEVVDANNNYFYSVPYYNESSKSTEQCVIGMLHTQDCADLTIPSGANIICDNLFDCLKLVSGSNDLTLSIPKTVKSIGDFAFDNGRISNTTVCFEDSNAPSSLVNIGKNAFKNPKSNYLEDVPNNFKFNMVYDATNDENVYLPDNEENTNLTLYMANNAFENNSVLKNSSTKLTIGRQYPVISAYAFYNCSNITKLTLEDGITKIRHHAFANCSNIESITIPESVTEIGYRAFANSISKYAIILNPSALIESQSIGYLVDDDGVATVRDITIYGYAGSTAEKYAKENGINFMVIDNGATNADDFEYEFDAETESIKITKYVGSNEEVIIPVLIDGYLVKAVDSSTFSDTNVTSITIPDSVTDASSICVSTLKRIVTGNGITSLSSLSLSSCKDSLEEIVIGNGITEIPDRAFEEFKLLKTVIMSDSIKSIGYSAFSKCTSLSDIVFSDKVTIVGNYAFYECTSLTSVTIPNGVTGIGAQAFDGCTSLIKITVPDTVTSIGNKAFGNCTSLKALTLLSNIKEIDRFTFSNSDSIKELTVGNKIENTDWINENWPLESIVIGDGITNISFLSNYSNTAKNIVIGNGVKEIPDSIKFNFYWEKLESVYIGDGITNINNGTFYECPSLKNVYLSQGLKQIDNFAFAGCPVLKSISIPDSVVTIGESAFRGCESLADVYLGSGIQTIKRSAFENCISLKGITLPDSLKSIKTQAFANCDIIEIDIPSSVTEIEMDAFSGVLNVNYSNSGYTMNSPWGAKTANGFVDGYLVYQDSSKTELLGCYIHADEVAIADGVTVIREKVFEDCASLKSVTIPSSVANIEALAFYRCSSLEEITCYSKTVSINSSASFLNCNSITTVRGYAGSTIEAWANNKGYTFISLD